MSLLKTAVRQIAADLENAGVSFAVVGGLAVSARTEPRFTRDADLAVAVASDQEAETLIRNLGARDYQVRATVEQEAVGRLATARLVRATKSQSPIIDLLFASSGIEPEIVAQADTIELMADLTIAVARTSHLIALKVLARDDVQRLQDLADLRALLRVASLAELTHARESLELISARGYHRGRSLLAEFDALCRVDGGGADKAFNTSHG